MYLNITPRNVGSITKHAKRMAPLLAALPVAWTLQANQASAHVIFDEPCHKVFRWVNCDNRHDEVRTPEWLIDTDFCGDGRRPCLNCRPNDEGCDMLNINRGHGE